VSGWHWAGDGEQWQSGRAGGVDGLGGLLMRGRRLRGRRSASMRGRAALRRAQTTLPPSAVGRTPNAREMPVRALTRPTAGKVTGKLCRRCCGRACWRSQVRRA
jgi:hypothetical protein